MRMHHAHICTPLSTDEQLPSCTGEGIPANDASKQSQLSRKRPGFARTLRVRSFTEARVDLGEILYTFLFPFNTSFPLA